MGRDQHDDRKRALALGKFKFLYQEDVDDLETTDKFKLAVVQNKLLGPVMYRDRDGKDPEVMKIYGQARKDIGCGFAEPDIKIPGSMKTFTVVWSNPFGDIFLDADIKLFEFEDIQKYSGYNDPPKSKEFCRFYTSSSSKDLDGFDSSIFWTAGLLWKFFSTCGVEAWDRDFGELVGHYKNWREWAHTVHNLNKGEGPRKREEGRREDYARDQRSMRRLSGNNNTPGQAAAPPRPAPPAGPYSVPPPQIVLPGAAVAAPVYMPVQGQNGSAVQVQMVSLPPSGASAPPTPGSRFKYINPHHVPPPLPHIPVDNKSAVWTNQVDDFLSRPSKSPPSRSSTPRKRKRSSKDEEPELKKTQVAVNIAALVAANTSPTRSIDPAKIKARILEKQESVQERKAKRKARISEIQEALQETKAVQEMKEQERLPEPQGVVQEIKEQGGLSEKDTPVQEMKEQERLSHTEGTDQESMSNEQETGSKFRPKASVLPPSPSQEEAQAINPLDVKPGVQVIEGKVTDWRGKFGFMSSDQMEGKIFLHSKDFVEGRQLARVGATAYFQVLHQESSVVGAKAVNVRILE